MTVLRSFALEKPAVGQGEAPPRSPAGCRHERQRRLRRRETCRPGLPRSGRRALSVTKSSQDAGFLFHIRPQIYLRHTPTARPFSDGLLFPANPLFLLFRIK